jgi:hypothetical protein
VLTKEFSIQELAKEITYHRYMKRELRWHLHDEFRLQLNYHQYHETRLRNNVTFMRLLLKPRSQQALLEVNAYQFECNLELCSAYHERVGSQT